MANYWVRVALDVPLEGTFDYRVPAHISAQRGQRVIVPFGTTKQVIGVIMQRLEQTDVPVEKQKDIIQLLDDLPPFSEDWLALGEFAARYYLRPIGEVLLPVLPPSLRKVTAYMGKTATSPVQRLDQRVAAKALREEKARAKLIKSQAKLEKSQSKAAAASALSASTIQNIAQAKLTKAQSKAEITRTQADSSIQDEVQLSEGEVVQLESQEQLPTSLTAISPEHGDEVLSIQHADGDTLSMQLPGGDTLMNVISESAPELNAEQQAAVDTITALQEFKTILLHGVTGSGKTEVYLHAAAQVLAQGKQVIFLVPEINLTPQFEQTLHARFAPLYGAESVAVMHSGLSDGERLAAWLTMQRGTARIVLGTRMSIFAPMEHLGLIIVDEEHDPSYKQQDGLRYSARDLSIWRAQQLNIPVVLGSATPSLESWQHAKTGRYLKLTLNQRAKATTLPVVKLINTKKLVLEQGFSAALISAIDERLQRGEQSLIYLNRRGYAPVVRCTACDWTSECPRCSVHTVLHRVPGHGHVLQCHHCGYVARAPFACPDCGNQDIRAFGQGTQRIEQSLAELFPQATIQRIDADSTRLKGSAQQLFAQVHAGEIDILVGTQMVAKGHDFKRLSLVGILNADAMLFSGDFRAPERLFAQLMQVTGRAGRHLADAEVLLQTEYPEQPIYQALVQHEYERFADNGLMERQQAGLPPYAYQVLISTQDKTIQKAIESLQTMVALAREHLAEYLSQITIYDPIPLRIVRVANIERAQLLLESSSRAALHRFMPLCLQVIREHAPRLRFTVEVDPLEI